MVPYANLNLEALRSIKGCEHVTLPYLDETGPDTRENGFPAIFNEPNFQLDGEIIDNPLYSYELPQNITDSTPKDLYTKGKGYKTVRFPRSGLVGTAEAREESAIHNKQFTIERAADLLNENIKNWLGQHITVEGNRIPTGARRKFYDALHAPNYTVYSNTTSAQAWNNMHASEEHNSLVISIESPHNDIHLALGGFQIQGLANFSAVIGANGDMVNFPILSTGSITF